ncbi:MAG TPA: helix-turn-helix domain-containing protein, partial [Solirubrobacterales bacterium]|nr:helix-turn-helix domain-containing protein [Solirubrobacterales bacterium]
LAVRREKRQVWAWLGGRRALDSTGLCSRLDPLLPPGSSLAVGEPGEGLDGWRCTHRQAAAALPVGRRRGDRVVRYADVALLTAVLRDDLLATSLRRSYLEPLAGGRAGGEALLQTLRAYFAAGRNSASAAAALGITRQTVGNRLRAVEQRLGLPLDACCSDLEIALELQEIGS